jgi:hypothetical protein
VNDRPAASAPSNRPLFGRYEILDTLGGGGMASVYRASQRGLAGAVRPVALKVIHPHLSGDDAFVRMFLDEMRVAMALQHRNIVQTLDAGEVGQRHYIAMELVAGCTLRQLLRRSGAAPIPVDIALFIAAELAAALHYAHTFQPELTGQPSTVVHRDVSPSNVLLSKDGDVKLTDFGVARARDNLRQQSISDAVKGKLAYMSPEQARGDAVPGSDIFALGATLYELLSKRPLRKATTLEQVLHGPIALEPIHPLRPEVPPELDALLSACLDPAVEGRPGSAELLEQVLREQLGAQQQLASYPVDMRTRLRAYLGELPAEATGDPVALRLAQALLAEAQAEHSLTGETGTATEIASPGARDSRWRANDGGEPPTEGGGGEAATEAYRSPLRQAEAPESAEDLAAVAALTSGVLAEDPDTATAALAQRTRSPWPWIVLVLGVLGIGGGLTVFYLTRGPAVSGGSGDQSTFATRGFGPGDAGRPPPRVDATTIPKARDAASTKTAKPSSKQAPATKKPPIKRRPRGHGTLNVNATRWVQVRVDGKVRGHTPLQELKLTAGRHKVELIDPRSKKVVKVWRVRIRARKAVTKVAELP